MMIPLNDDDLLRAAFAPARALEPSDAEIDSVLSRWSSEAPRTAPAGQRRGAALSRLRVAALVATTLMALLGAGYAAAPPVRAALGDIAGTLGGWLGGDSDAAPGRALGSAEDAPAYFRDPRFARDPRVIAEADGYKLYVYREPGGTMGFDLGNTGYGEGGVMASDFREHAVSVLGPGVADHADEHGHVPLFGISARSVKTVELTYESGPSLRVSGLAGGFVLLAEPERRPRAVIGYDTAGRELERESVSDIHWSGYGPAGPRVPAECLPGPAGDDPPRSCPSPEG